MTRPSFAETVAPAGAAAATPSEALRAFLALEGFGTSDLEARGAHGLTPLMRAALRGKLEQVEELLALGASVHASNEDGNTALWLGCVSGSSAVVRRLCTAGSELDHRNAVGATALMYTASSGKQELCELLLELGADPFIRNVDGARAGEMAANLACLALLRHTIE